MFRYLTSLAFDCNPKGIFEGFIRGIVWNESSNGTEDNECECN